MKTLALVRFRDRIRRGLVVAFGALSVIVVGVSVLLPGQPLWSALLGLGASAIIMGFSAFSIGKMVASEDIGLGWLVLDYVVKIAAVAGAVLLAKNWSVLDPQVVAVVVIVAIVTTVVVQLVSIQKKQREDRTG